MLTELQAQCQKEYRALIVTMRSQAGMIVSKEAKPDGLESASEKGDKPPESDGQGFVERPDGHGYDCGDKSESEKDVPSENRTEVTASETRDSQSEHSDMTQLFPFEDNLVKKSGSSQRRMTRQERKQNNWRKPIKRN